jgi:predicted acetyltransferase
MHCVQDAAVPRVGAAAGGGIEPVLGAATPTDHELLGRLWQLYRHDLSEFRDSRPDAAGLFKTERLASYLGDHEVLVVRVGEVPAGFVFVRASREREWTLGEFFLLRHYRRSGLGRRTALDVLRGRPGRWEIAFQEENPAAARFWRRIAAEVTGDDWTEQRRPVPDKPHLPPDVWLTLTVS